MVKSVVDQNDMSDTKVKSGVKQIENTSNDESETSKDKNSIKLDVSNLNNELIGENIINQKNDLIN